MHLLVLADTFPEFWDDFKKWVEDLRFKNKKQYGVYVRELKLFDIWFNQEAEEEVTAYLKGREKTWGRGWFKSLARFLAGFILKPPKKVKPKYPDDFLAHVVILGKLEDQKCKVTGKEIT